MSGPPHASTTTPLHFLVVRVGPATYGIPAGPVRQLLSSRSATSSLPPIPILDLRARLHPSLPPQPAPQVVVLEWPPGHLTRLVVDKFYEVIPLAPSSIHTLPRSTSPVCATTRRKGRSCYLLDLDLLLAPLNTPDRCA